MPNETVKVLNYKLGPSGTSQRENVLYKVLKCIVQRLKNHLEEDEKN